MPQLEDLGRLGPLVGGIVYQVTESPVALVFGINIVVLLLALFGYVRLPLPRSAPTEGFPWPRFPHVPAQHRRHVFNGAAVFAPGLTATSFVLALGPSVLILAVGNTSPLLAGAAACVMFLAATGSQLVLTRLPARQLFALGTAGTVLAMTALALTVATKNPWLFVTGAVLAGTGQGLGQLGGLRLIAHHVEAGRRAEANAALNISAYLPAAIVTVATGYTVGQWGMPAAATALAAALGVPALVLGIASYRRTSEEYGRGLEEIGPAHARPAAPVRRHSAVFACARSVHTIRSAAEQSEH